MEPKHQRDEHNHAGASDFQHLIWVCWLSPVWYNVLDLIAINFNWSNRPWNFVQREISSTKLHKPLLTHLINYSTFSIYCIFLYLSFYLSWNNKHNMPKLLLFFLDVLSNLKHQMKRSSESRMMLPMSGIQPFISSTDIYVPGIILKTEYRLKLFSLSHS